MGYELATLDDLDGDGLPELAIAVASVVVYTGILPIELQAGGTLIVPGRRVLDGDLGSVREGWFLAGSAGQQEPVFTGASYLPRLTAHGPDGFLIGELMHHRGAGAVVRVPATVVAAPARPLTISPSGWVDGPGLSPRIELDDGLLSGVGEGTAVGGEFTFGSAATALDGAPFLAIAAMQTTGPETRPRAGTELVPRARLDELQGTLAETDDLEPWRILGDEHPSPEWLDEDALETDLGRVAQHIEASSGWWTVLLAACLLLSPEYGDHQCLADFAGLFQFAPTAMASYPRSAHVPAGFEEGLVIGEPLFDGGRGALHAVLPDWTQAPAGSVELAPLATPPEGWMVSRLDGEPGSWLGHSVAMPGDMDGDGLDDIVVGAPGVPADQDAIPGAAHLLLSRLHADHDGDGLGISGGDGDDGDPESYPGATERCDGADNDCDGVVPLDEHDEDDDGHMPCGGDCDDADPERYPADADGDGYGPCDGDCDDGDPELDPGDRDGDGYSTCDGDCDDSDPDRDLGDLDGDGWSSCGAVRDCDDHDASIHPDADETGDGVDNDCDGLVDEGVPTAMGCGWSDAGRSADLMRPGAFLALGLLLSLRIRPRRRDPAGMRRPRSTPRG